MHFQTRNIKLISLLIVTLISCNRDHEKDIPDVYVNFQINILTDPEFFSLQIPNNSVEITAGTIGLSNLGYGNNGVILYNNGNDEFLAFDRTCMYEFPNSNIAVEISGTGLAVCPQCESEYMLPSYGTPSKGPAQHPLKTYRTSYNPFSGELAVFN